ncbi:MAG TPA: NAD(P)/FAD-dependent oxidoreductase [Xanthobacteraceae bacterium]|nr:NAD(P)/FAD-dependent oxidoreductase [Xanthobacteraceae bacterium]
MIRDVEALPETVDLAIVGAGPAGLAAAATAAGLGLSVLMLDENPNVGGQIYRAITTNPVKDKDLLGADYWRGERLARAAAASSAQHAAGAIVWSVSPREGGGYEIGVSIAGRSRLVTAREVMLATGALERPFPIPGWTLPGVMSCGGAQTVLKASGLVPAGRVAIAGCGPLLWLIAWQYLNAGVAIEAILDTTPQANWLSALRHLPALLASPYFAKGLKLMRSVSRRARVVSGVTALRAEGSEKVEAVVYAKKSGREQRITVDTLLLHQGVVPNINLANAIGCRHVWDGTQLTWKPETDAWGATSVPGITVAGDGAGIAGAEAAAERGRIAALGVAQRLGRIDAIRRDREAAAARTALARFLRGRAFLDTLYRPAKAFRVPEGDTLACRCEEVTAARIRATVPLGAIGPNQMKSFLRCGMGPCQGRECGLTVAELIADVRGVTMEEVGYYRLRPPVKPIALGELAAMPKTESAEKAVVRV